MVPMESWIRQWTVFIPYGDKYIDRHCYGNWISRDTELDTHYPGYQFLPAIVNGFRLVVANRQSAIHRKDFGQLRHIQLLVLATRFFRLCVGEKSAEEKEKERKSLIFQQLERSNANESFLNLEFCYMLIRRYFLLPVGNKTVMVIII